MKDYYVYVYYRLDINEPFYVGKGHNERWKRLKRNNPHFNNIAKSTSIAVVIEKDNLTEEQAFYWEERIIEELIFEYGFSIEIKNNYTWGENYCHLVNQTFGGEGASGWRHSEETLQRAVNNREYKKGKDCPHSVSVVCLNTNEVFYSIDLAIKKYNASEVSAVCKNKRNSSGRLSDGTRLVWMYLNDYLMLNKNDIENRLNKSRDIIKNKQQGLKNPMAKSVICLTTKRIFFTAREASTYYKCDHTGIGKCCKNKANYCGKLKNGTKLKWKYLIWNHDKKYRIKAVTK